MSEVNAVRLIAGYDHIICIDYNQVTAADRKGQFSLTATLVSMSAVYAFGYKFPGFEKRHQSANGPHDPARA
jgi:hypothetical protein